MNIQLTEQIIRERANEQSFQKGLEYYQAGAIYNTSWQSTPDGMALTSSCSGSSEYHLRVEMDADGVRAAFCTCPYDWGGDCKHIVALLLSYLHAPAEFSEQKSVAELLSGLEKESLVALIARLVERLPDLYDELHRALPLVNLAAKAPVQPQATPAKERPQTQVSEPVYRKQIKLILRQSRYHEDDDYDEVAPAYLDDLQETLQTAKQFLDAGDAEGALIILRVLFEETSKNYDYEMDYDGDVAGFIQDLGLPLAEAILSVELDAQAHADLQKSMRKVYDALDDGIESSALDVIFAALEYGWNTLSEDDIELEEDGEDIWMSYEQLEQARLNVLERQGRTAEFLQLAQTADSHRYLLKLLQLGQMEEAIAASQSLSENRAILDIAKKLHAAGREQAALSLAERGLEQGGHAIYELALWLAPLEEAQGRKDLALLAYRAAYDAQPIISLYRHVKRLAGTEWENIRPALIEKVDETKMPVNMADIQLEERNWDDAIRIAEKFHFYTGLLDRVVEAVIPVRPDWVINVSLKQANDLIAPTQSKLYPDAAKWLARAKKAYQAKGQVSEWQAYISQLRVTYARRPSLQKAIAHL